jgi:hypothetical protein
MSDLGTVTMIDLTGNYKTGYALDAWYGVEWDITAPACTITRIGRADLVAAQPIYQKIRFALVNNDRSINYYLDKANHNLRENGAASDLSGVSGQVMGILPVFYFLFEYEGNKRRLKISDYALPGYAAFKRTGIGKYLCSIDGGGLMASVTGVLPAVNYACSFAALSFGIRARNRGTGWNPVSEFQDLQLQILELVYTANFNAQTAISTGATNDDGGWSFRGYGGIKNNGLSNSYGDYTGSIPFIVTDWFKGTVSALSTNKCIHTGRFATAWNAAFIGMTIKNTVTNATATIISKDSNDQITISADIFTAIGQTFTIIASTFATQSAIFAGFEDHFGHLYQWLPGLLVNYSAIAEAFRCKDASKMADTITADFVKVGEMPMVDGYITSLIPGTMLPLTVGGSSATYMADYYYHSGSSGVRIVLSRGSLIIGAASGPRSVSALSAPGLAYSTVSARLGLTFAD